MVLFNYILSFFMYNFEIILFRNLDNCTQRIITVVIESSIAIALTLLVQHVAREFISAIADFQLTR